MSGSPIHSPSGQTNSQSRSPSQIVVVGLVGSILAALVYLVLWIQNPVWQLLGLFINTLLLVAAASISLLLVRRGRMITGILILIYAAQIIFAVGTGLIAGLGLAFGIGIVFLHPLVATTTLPPREIVRTAITAVISGVICIFLDVLAPAYRLAPPPAVSSILPAIIAGVALILTLSLIREFRHSLRAKLLLGFTGVVLLAGLFAVFSIQQHSQNMMQDTVSNASNVAESIALAVGRNPAGAQDYVSQLSMQQQRNVTILDLHKQIVADPQISAVFTTYNSDPAGEVAATMQDGHTRIFTPLGSGSGQTHMMSMGDMGPTGTNMIVVPVRDQSGKISGAAIVDYSSILSESDNSMSTTVQALSLLGALGFILVFTLLQLISSQIAGPITLLRNAAVEVGSGRLDAAIPDSRSQDEVGTLTSTFKIMTAKVRDLVESLEQHVAERTSELAFASQLSSQRAQQLQAISKVSEAITVIHDLEAMLPIAVETIGNELNYYHVGIYLTDEAQQFVFLKAANSSGGQRMLEDGYRLKIGDPGIVSIVAAKGVPRIALDTGVDAILFNNPDLRNTRSEMALPLFSEGRVVGVLDVQSEQSSAFKQDDINVLTTLANQVGIAIQNARVFEETNRSLREARATYEQYIRSAFGRATAEKSIGYRFAGTNISRYDAPLELAAPELSGPRAGIGSIAESASPKNPALLTVPIRMREDIIGVLNLRKPDRSEWNEDEIDITQAIAARVALAVENATLVEDSQRRASSERLIGEITSKISASINMRNVLQTAVEELGRSIPGSDVIIQFQGNIGVDEPEKPNL
jgi:GAF domain-containing protein/HAMP domain-containing protein